MRSNLDIINQVFGKDTCSETLETQCLITPGVVLTCMELAQKEIKIHHKIKDAKPSITEKERVEFHLLEAMRHIDIAMDTITNKEKHYYNIENLISNKKDIKRILNKDFDKLSKG